MLLLDVSKLQLVLNNLIMFLSVRLVSVIYMFEFFISLDSKILHYYLRHNKNNSDILFYLLW